MKGRAESALDNLSQGGLLDNVRIEQQRKMLHAFSEFKGNNASDKILDVALFPSTSFPHIYSLIELLPAEERDLVSNCKVISSSEQSWRTVAGNMQLQGNQSERKLPYGDNEFEWVFCNLVLEHAGTSESQNALLQELWRVAGKGIFVTAANKRHPIDFNTGLPLLHWLSKPSWERNLQRLGKLTWTAGHMPNLLDASTLENMAHRLPGSPAPLVGHVRFLGVKSHFFLMAEK